MKCLILLAIALSSAVAAPGKGDTCPLMFLRDNCAGRKSECWSPGEHDIDCPDQGLCCFDGCVNTCGVPTEPPTTTPPPPECQVEFVPQDETVEMETCVDVPGEDMCTDVVSQECENHCIEEDDEVTVEDVTKCCTKKKVLVCKEKPCEPTTEDINVTVNETVCRIAPQHCFEVPEQVCVPEEVEECTPVETQECEQVKKPEEWPTTEQECVIEYTNKCSIVMKEFCTFRHHKSKKGPRKICKLVPKRQCERQPWSKCTPKTTIKIEWVYTKECKTVVKDVCTKITKNACTMKQRQECVEAQEICETKTYDKTTTVRGDCTVTDKDCHFEDQVSCEETKVPSVKWVPKKTCRNVCQPANSHQCVPGKPKKECRMVTKVMTYDVPVVLC